MNKKKEIKLKSIFYHNLSRKKMTISQKNLNSKKFKKILKKNIL